MVFFFNADVGIFFVTIVSKKVKFIPCLPCKTIEQKDSLFLQIVSQGKTKKPYVANNFFSVLG